MAITQAMCTSFKAQVLLGTHNFHPTGSSAADTFKIALYTASATLLNVILPKSTNPEVVPVSTPLTVNAEPPAT